MNKGALILLLLPCLCSTVYAAPTEQDLAKIEAQIKQAKQQQECKGLV